MVETRWKRLAAILGDSRRRQSRRIDVYMPVRQLAATNDGYLCVLCKPEVTGSIPVRSINEKQAYLQVF
jgi:hypothetical protein